MTNQNKLSARQLALDVLNQCNIQKHDTSTLLHKKLNQTLEKSVATDMVFGVIRNMITIDRILNKISMVEADRVKKNIMNSLRLAVYQLVYCPFIPDYAAVNEAVKMSKNKKERGFINAVLRNIVRATLSKEAQSENIDSEYTIPITNNAVHLFNKPIMPNPKKDPQDYLVNAYSLPLWLVKEWIQSFGFDKAQEICRASNRRPAVYIRPNSLKTSIDDLIKELSSNAINAQIVDNMIMLDAGKAIHEISGFESGLFSVQDITASKVATFLNPAPNSILVDLCAAPGTKTCHFAEVMHNQGTIIATDIDSKRLEKITPSANRLGISIIQSCPYEMLNQAIEAKEKINYVLVDVPCSNTGVLSRRVEARYRISENYAKGLIKTQISILKKAFSIIPPGGQVCYSTCSILNSENSAVVNSFIGTNKNASLIKEHLTLPSSAPINCDGGYVAIIEKKI